MIWVSSHFGTPTSPRCRQPDCKRYALFGGQRCWVTRADMLNAGHGE